MMQSCRKLFSTLRPEKK